MTLVLNIKNKNGPYTAIVTVVETYHDLNGNETKYLPSSNPRTELGPGEEKEFTIWDTRELVITEKKED